MTGGSYAYFWPVIVKVRSCGAALSKYTERKPADPPSNNSSATRILFGIRNRFIASPSLSQQAERLKGDRCAACGWNFYILLFRFALVPSNHHIVARRHVGDAK